MRSEHFLDEDFAILIKFPELGLETPSWQSALLPRLFSSTDSWRQLGCCRQRYPCPFYWVLICSYIQTHTIEVLHFSMVLPVPALQSLKPI